MVRASFGDKGFWVRRPSAVLQGPAPRSSHFGVAEPSLPRRLTSQRYGSDSPRPPWTPRLATPTPTGAARTRLGVFSLAQGGQGQGVLGVAAAGPGGPMGFLARAGKVSKLFYNSLGRTGG